MKLTPMRFKDYTWPHNPETCRVELERKMAVQKAPFGGYVLQDMGALHRVMRGEGAFVGENAYEEFRKLVRVFEEDGAGTLVHPVWRTMLAHFVALEVLEEPKPDYVRYTFEFWESCGETAMKLLTGGRKTKTAESRERVVVTAALDAGDTDGENAAEEYHTVLQGDTLWGIALQHGLTLEEVVRLNPQVKNPNLIHPGDEVRIR